MTRTAARVSTGRASIQRSSIRRDCAEHDPRLVRALRLWLAWGLLAVVLVPAARAQTTALGWLPMYLVAMPAVALWALHRLALPRWLLADARVGQARRRRRGPQARRRERPLHDARRLRAA